MLCFVAAQHHSQYSPKAAAKKAQQQQGALGNAPPAQFCPALVNEHGKKGNQINYYHIRQKQNQQGFQKPASLRHDEDEHSIECLYKYFHHTSKPVYCQMKGWLMKGFNKRKYCYVFLWLALVLTVGIVWISGGSRVEEGEDIVKQKDAPSSEASLAKAPDSTADEKLEELLGVWVPYMSLTPAEYTQEAFRENFINIADSAKEKGLNALFVHVRPFGDALYPSRFYPWSHILTGEQGKDPGYDPLEFMVSYTHELGMEFHAWINPLRVSTGETPGGLSDDNPYVVLRDEHPYYFMEYNGGVYLDPAYQYVRTLIADGAGEIVKNYSVDGVHFDDYFYPCEDESLDSEAYQLYTQNVEKPLTLLQWRRANISALVQQVYREIKEENSQAIFGISPQGNISNDENMGADVKAWCAVEGYIDYICPQLYYSFENEALGYGEALLEWKELKRHEGLKLYIGLALYKAGSDADNGTWQLSQDNIKRQIQAARDEECNGVVLYSWSYLDTEQTREEVKNAMAAIIGEGDR